MKEHIQSRENPPIPSDLELQFVTLRGAMKDWFLYQLRKVYKTIDNYAATRKLEDSEYLTFPVAHWKNPYRSFGNRLVNSAQKISGKMDLIQRGSFEMQPGRVNAVYNNIENFAMIGLELSQAVENENVSKHFEQMFKSLLRDMSRHMGSIATTALNSGVHLTDVYDQLRLMRSRDIVARSKKIKALYGSNAAYIPIDKAANKFADAVTESMYGDVFSENEPGLGRTKRLQDRHDGLEKAIAKARVPGKIPTSKRRKIRALLGVAPISAQSLVDQLHTWNLLGAIAFANVFAQS